MQRSRFTLSTDPSSIKSGAPRSMVGELVSSSGSVVTSIETIGGDFLRRRISTRLTTSLCSQVEKADSPRKVWILRNSSTNTSWTRSSASVGSPSMRKQSAYTRSEEHTSELQSPDHLVCRLLLEKKNNSWPT